MTSNFGYRNISAIISEKYSFFIDNYASKIFESLFIVIIGTVIAYLSYRITIYLFKRFNIIGLINKVEGMLGQKVENKKSPKKDKPHISPLSERFKIDEVVAKSIAYYLFIVFFRLAISVIGIDDVENFLEELLRYLPKLFIGALIGYFGFRAANFIHDIAYYTIGINTKGTAKIIATGLKGVILFFTIMAVLDQIGIATEITTTILNGFIAMLTIAGGLAFGLGGKEVAREILESFRK